jgi:hypothetical protein
LQALLPKLGPGEFPVPLRNVVRHSPPILLIPAKELLFGAARAGFSLHLQKTAAENAISLPASRAASNRQLRFARRSRSAR